MNNRKMNQSLVERSYYYILVVRDGHVIFVRQMNLVVQTRRRRHIVRVHSLEVFQMTKSRTHTGGSVSGICVCGYS